MSEENSLSEFIKVDDWVRDYAGPFFPNRFSFEWFLKQHRAELVSSGAVILGGGRSQTLVSKKLLPELVLKIRRRAGEAKLGVSAVQ